MPPLGAGWSPGRRGMRWKWQWKTDWPAVSPSLAPKLKPAMEGSAAWRSAASFRASRWAAAKAGVHGFTKALAQEVARKGVTVNTVSPGYLATEMVMAVREDVRQKIVDAIPVGRLGQPAEIAALVAFIASEAAAFMTGSNVAMNGGQHMY